MDHAHSNGQTLACVSVSHPRCHSFFGIWGVPAENIYLISTLVREVTGSNKGNLLLFIDISLKSIIHCVGAHRYHVLNYIH